jgi:hypothetical protein
MLSKQEEEQERRGSTLHEYGLAQAGELSGGRFGALGTPTVTGATPIPNYPAAGAHQRDPCGQESPLGYSIDQLESSALPCAEATGAPAGATHAADNLPPSQDGSDDAGAPLSQIEDE